ncbi:MAG: ATP synthase F1 subunit gamma [Patescibacteria group bacterium]|nr:ATP synthase F1 subunit gamma [Patescibacteria group bacterium]
MAGTKEIKRRIKSVKNTKKITRAMELVAASKMKRAISQTLASRMYAEYSWNLLTSLSERLEDTTHPFFEENDNEKALIVLITSNRGLCGGYNSQIIKKIMEMLKINNMDIVTIGKKGDHAMRRIGQNVIASFLELPDTVDLNDINPISKYITGEFKNYSKIYIAYTDFVSALNQKPNVRQLLPVSKEELKEVIESLGEGKKEVKEIKVPYLFEGNIAKILSSLVEKLVQMQIYQMILESYASEQSSRMVTMKNANEAAEEMVEDLTLVFNKARQAGITREISEISAGMASMN